LCCRSTRQRRFLDFRKRNRAHRKLLQLPDEVRNGLLGRDSADDPSSTAAEVRYAYSPIFHLRGASLLILLFAADACLPEPKTTRFSKPQMSETLHIRIRSEHKWPEKIVFVSAREPVPPQRKPGLFFSSLRCIGPRSEDIEPQVHAIVDDGVEQGAGRTVICLHMNPEASVSEHREEFRQSLSL
jgi:hypothetical protein